MASLSPASSPASSPVSAPLGAHVSAAGGVSEAFGRAAKLGCDALQLFVKNASRWHANPLGAEEIARFRAAHLAQGCLPVVAHASYLINLAATDPDTLRRSRAALKDELERCHALGVGGLVLHPGAHLGRGQRAGLAAVVASLNEVLSARPEADVKVLLENTAGQGTVLGSRFEQLAWIRAQADAPERLGVCFDTCHAFAAGYDLRERYEEVITELGETVGWDNLACVHLNDSQHALGSRKDRHANLGAGHLGLNAFAELASDARLAGVPMVLETPLGSDQLGHKRDLERLRTLLAPP